MNSSRTDSVSRIARQDFGWSSLLPGQREAIESAASGRDTLLVLATGGGKSAVYQIAGAERGGVVLVVSPLVALQADQLAAIEAAPAAPPAVAINSSQGAAAVARAWDRIDEGGPLYVLLAPEQLAKPENVARLAAAGVSLLVVDEAHCVSSWGHDFRPDYLRLADVRGELGDPPVLAMTATASGPVRDEIIERLRMTDPEIQVHGVDRPEIRLVVHRHESENEKRAAVVEEARSWTAPGLVYVATRKETEAYAADIAAEGAGSRRTTPGSRCPSGRSSTSSGAPASSTSSSRPRPSGWASTGPTSASCCTPRPPSRSTPTTRRSAARAATASPPRARCTTAPRTWGSAASSPSARSTRPRCA